MEYSDVDWDPPARWDNGIPGIILDYNINNQLRHDQESGSEEQSISGNGTLGANLGAWRLRADWQASYDHRDDDENTSTLHDQSWSRYYAYRALPTLGAKLTLGESYLQSDVFDSFNYIGASVVSDDQMLPPKLRGYAPEIVGIARSNAKVKVSWQGRVLYETQVPAGPFRIQDLNQSVSGTLHVTVEEQNGQTQEFDVNTASVPFLTRPGMVRYKMALGRPQDWDHHPITGTFASAEASWGSPTAGRSMAAQLEKATIRPWRWEAVRILAWWARWRSTLRTPSPTCRKTTGLTAKRCRVTHIASATPVTLMKSTAD